ncbi:hypothetical protein DSL92_01725 [Billgrantia gudaonensis]|uniref:Uncharacterized protein n=1 Tax=Billgrantia gudaonensis TaxID=376427 RepID=A0A432JLL9_9GAMM|nr:hypothetical protein DSL92_01725 [Halomonas gudaonensis]
MTDVGPTEAAAAWQTIPGNRVIGVPQRLCRTCRSCQRSGDDRGHRSLLRHRAGRRCIFRLEDPKPCLRAVPG